MAILRLRSLGNDRQDQVVKYPIETAAGIHEPLLWTLRDLPGAKFKRLRTEPEAIILPRIGLGPGESTAVRNASESCEDWTRRGGGADSQFQIPAIQHIFENKLTLHFDGVDSCAKARFFIGKL